MSSGWIDAVDITRLLFPLSNTTVTFRPWEFSRDRTLFQYDNPLYDGELFHLWRNSHDIDSWDKNHPGRGIIIQHLDLHANPEGLPIQQRLESHFIYMMVQADGQQDMEAGRNGGDAGDSWPGSANAAVWNKNTDPSNRWYDEQPSGLEITNIRETDDTSSDVTFFWSPRELPTYIWVQPPREDVSHNGIFTLMFVAYDQFGGAEMWFYAVPSSPDDPTPGYDNGIALNNMAYTKQPGEIDGTFGANVRDLPDGTYTFYVQLVPGVGADGRLENTHSRPRAGIDNIGNGRVVHEVAGMVVEGVDVDISISKLEVWTLTVIDDRSPGAETWQVLGQYSGTQTAQAFTGLLYNSDPDTLGRSAVSFTIQAGNIPFRNGDRFSFMTTGLTPHSSAVLIDNGEVVKPEPPVAVASVDRGIQSGLAPLDVVFTHDGSSDPHGAALTFTWDFGDGSLPFTTKLKDLTKSHTYRTPGLYTARLTVTNAFNLSSQATVQIRVLRADAPTVRIDATPLSGPAPLQVSFSGERTTDSNPARQGLDYVWDFGDRSANVLDVRTTHTFAKPGTYVVTLTVTNRPYGESGSATVEIRATGSAADLPPNAVLDANKLFGKSPLAVQFDARQSSDPEGRALTYGWSFGDGAVLVDAPAVVEHTFQRVGNFPVTLTVTDVTDQSDTATLVVSVTANAASGSQAPVARILASTLQGPAPLAVTLDARDSSDPEGGPLSFAWSFGDDSNAQEGEVVTHTYTVAGQYTVRLVALDSSGATGETTVKIVVTSPAGETPSTQPSETGQTIPEIPTACSPGCGPVGLMPVLLTLLGIAGLRRCRNRWMG
jgi:PKD repeat protein